MPMGGPGFFFLGGGEKVLELFCSQHVFQVPKMFLNIFPTCCHFISYPLPVAKGDFRLGSKVRGPMNSSNLIGRKL